MFILALGWTREGNAADVCPLLCGSSCSSIAEINDDLYDHHIRTS